MRAEASVDCAALSPTCAGADGSAAMNVQAQGAGHLNVLALDTYEGWISLLARAVDLKQLGIALAWGAIRGHLLFGERGAGPVRPPPKARRSGELFPLPVLWPQDFLSEWETHHRIGCTGFSVECWVALICNTLNALYGVEPAKTSRTPGKVHLKALEGLRDKVERFLSGDSPVSFSFEGVVGE